MPLSAGTRLGPYEILEKLGEGGMGVVYKARDTRLGRLVAIKVLPPEKVADPERKRRFIQEARAASALNHPNIITIHDIGSEAGTDFLVMEYVEGRPLQRVIPRQGMRLAEVLECAIPIADALAKAHAAGIVHRDLKPANVMVGNDGSVKLLDFGLAKLLDNIPAGELMETVALGETRPPAPRTGDGAILGTVAYMSPEQAEAKAVDGRSDIFSFGAMLYEMLTGEQAFRGDSPVSTLAAILHKEPKPLSEAVPGIPREIERVIARCLRKDPAKRWQTMADVRTSLQEFKEDSESGRLSSGVIPEVQAPPKSPWRWLALAAAVIAVAGTGLWSLRGRQAPADAVYRAVPFTSYPGSQQNPALSPDGTQVAFAWDGEKQDNFDIYVKRIGPGPPLRLTHAPEVDTRPAWSPDGSLIAFLRVSSPGKQRIILIPPLGGPERFLAEVNLDVGGGSIAWSQDGKWIVSTDHPEGMLSGLWLISMDTGERRRLTTIQTGAAREDTYPEFSSNGEFLAFVREAGNNARDAYVLELDKNLQPRGEPRRLTNANQVLNTPVWTGDGKELLFAWGTPGNAQIWRMAVSGESPPRQAIEGGNEVLNVTYSARTNRVVFAQNRREIDIYRLELTGRGGEVKESVPLIVSSRLDRHPVYSPDGKKIAFSTLRSGSWQAWVSDSDGSNPVQLTSFDRGETRVTTWSPDGRQIGFASDAEGDYRAYTIDVNGGKPRKLDALGAQVDSWAWSRSGKWMFVAAGGVELRKVPAAGGPAVAMARGVTQYFAESPDGKLIYFSRGGTIWTVPVDGGEERKVVDNVAGGGPLAVANNGIYLLSRVNRGNTTSPGELMFYAFPNGPLTKVAHADSAASFGLSFSPDGRYLLYDKQTSTGSDLMLVEGFK